MTIWNALFGTIRNSECGPTLCEIEAAKKNGTEMNEKKELTAEEKQVKSEERRDWVGRCLQFNGMMQLFDNNPTNDLNGYANIMVGNQLRKK